MKPKSAKAERKKLPGARVMWALYNYGTLMQVSHTRKDLATLFCDGMPEMKAALKNGSFTISRCIVSPTLKSAQARLKIEQMPEGELVEGVAEAMWHSGEKHMHTRMDLKGPIKLLRNTGKDNIEYYRSRAEAVLNLLGRSGT